MYVPFLHREGYGSNHTMYTVRISKPGPRGGKRAPLMHCRVRALSYDDAVEFVEQEFLSTTKTEVTAG